MGDILNLPNIPTSSMFIDDEDRMMTIEWQEFFRGLFDRVGGTTSTTIIETDTSTIAELYKTDKNYTKRIDDLKKEIFAEPTKKSYDKRIDDLEKLIKISITPKLYNKKIAELELLLLSIAKEPFKFYLPQIVYEDLQVSISNIRVPAANAPTERLYNHGIGGGITFPVLGFTVDDYIYFDVQTQHSMKLSSVLDHHIHYMTPTDGTNDEFKFQLDVIAAPIGGSWAVPTGSPFTKEVSMTADLSTEHMLEDIADIPGINTTVSTIYKCKLTRIDVDGASDEYAGEIYLEFTDCHFQKDTTGSRNEDSK